MTIKRLKASFGKLEAQEIVFEDGLNIIAAPNESGKSTWCAFIRAMLYGVDSSERARAGHKPDKVRFSPWSGSLMEGEMDVIHCGRTITLLRTGRSSSPMREFRAVYTGTSDLVPGLTGDTAGDVLLGIPRAIFERSAFIRQAGIGVTGSPELSARIAAIVTTGDEDTPFEDVDSRLRAWQRRRKSRTSGTLPTLETKIRAKTLQLGDIERASRQRAELEAALNNAERSRNEIRKNLEESRKLQRQAALASMAESQRSIETCRNNLAAARENTVMRHSQLSHNAFGDEPPENIEAAAHSDARHAEDLLEQTNVRTSVALPVILSALCLLSSIAGAVSTNILLFAAAGLFLAGAVAAIWVSLKKRKLADAAALELHTLLSRYSALEPQGILDALSIHIKLWNEYEEALDHQREAEYRLREEETRQADTQQEILSHLNFQDGDSDSTQITEELSRAEESVKRLRDEISSAGGRISVLGDPMVLRSELSALDEQNQETTREFDAISLAIEILNEANAEIQARFSPALSRRAGEIFADITGREHEEVRFDRDLNAMVRRAGDAISRESLFLSEGAQNALYLALRLAICELAMPDEAEKCPLILDDALVTLDDERAGNALNFLKKAADERQIILFTCHSREKTLLDGQTIA